MLKQTRSLVDSGMFNQIHIQALWQDGLALEEKIDAHRTVHRIKFVLPAFLKWKPFYALKYLNFLWKAYRFVQKEKIDCVNIHEVALLPLVILLKLGSRKTLIIYDAHELETETVNCRGIRQRILRQVEKALIHSVDHVFVVGDAIRQWYIDKYGIQNITTIRNLPLPQMVAASDKLRTIYQVPPAQKILLYQGILTEGRGVGKLIRFFKEQADLPAVLIFMGYGPMEETITEAGKTDPRIIYHPAVPPSELLSYTASADIGLCFIENVCLSYYYSLPNKMFEYMMAGIPVCVSDFPEMSAIVNRYGVGMVTHPENADFTGKMNSFIRGFAPTPELKNKLKQAAAELNWVPEAEKMIGVYKKLYKV